MSTTTAPTPDALWNTLLGFIEAAFSLFGAPVDIAQKIWLPRSQYKLAADYLRNLEAILRRLLFIAALELTPPPRTTPIETKARARYAAAGNAGAAFDMDHSEAWRAPFACVLRPPHAHAAHARAKRTPPNNVASAPIALRLEALIRAFNDPAPLVLRLARRLHAEPHRAEAFLHLPNTRAGDFHHYFPVRQATQAAREALRRAIDSGKRLFNSS